MDCDKNACKRLRRKIYLTVVKGGMGHLASCYSCLEILYTLYVKKVMKYDIHDVSAKDRDRLVLSKGHAGVALYWVMCEAGMMKAEGIEASTGSLGHGLSMAVGMAMAQKLDQSNTRTFAIIGDGECEEGTIWEAAMSAPAFQLNNLVVILDCNEIQKMTTIEGTIGLVNWKEKWEAFGWLVKEGVGHEIEALEAVFTEKNDTDKPLFVIAHTIKGKGVSIMENNPLWHFKLPNRKEKKVFQEELEMPAEEMI